MPTSWKGLSTWKNSRRNFKDKNINYFFDWLICQFVSEAHHIKWWAATNSIQL